MADKKNVRKKKTGKKRTAKRFLFLFLPIRLCVFTANFLPTFVKFDD